MNDIYYYYNLPAVYFYKKLKMVIGAGRR